MMYLFLFFISLKIWGCENVIPISLGPNCAPALFLRHYNIRKEAYPFDWVVSSFDQVHNLIETDFENFFLKENLIIVPDSPYFVLDTYTGIFYNHDFPVEGVTDKSFEGEEGPDIGSIGRIVENFLDYYPAAYSVLN